MERQDKAMDEIGGVVRNLREIGEVMGNELEDQERFLIPRI
jgi:ATP-dependent 26S proteasome regulatory subunit